MVGLGLAIAGAVGLWRADRNVRFFAIAAAVGLLMAYRTPFDAILYFLVPGYSQSGSPGRVLVIWSLCASVLAAIGADALIRLRENAARDRFALKGLTWLAVISIVLLAASVIWLERNAQGFLGWIVQNETNSWRVPAAILLGAGAGYALWRKGSFSADAFGAVLVGLAALDLMAAGIGYNHTTTERSVYPVTGAIAFLKDHAGSDRVQPLNEHWSFNPAKPPDAVLPPNACTVYGLLDTQGYDSLFTAQYMNFAFHMDGDKSPAPAENGNMVFTYGVGSDQANRADARWLVSAEPLPPLPGLSLAYQGSDACVYRNDRAGPRAEVNGKRANLADLTEGDAPTRVTLSLAHAPGDDSRSGITVDLADQWYPGWTATVDGKPAAVEKDDTIFRLVSWKSPLPPGPAIVELRYEPTSYRLGLYAMCLALALTAAIVSRAVVERQRAGARTSSASRTK
jgi:hypothetical protein